MVQTGESLKYSFAISAVHTGLYQIDKTRDDCLRAIDDIGLACSVVQKSDKLFAKGDILGMQSQYNHVCLMGVKDILSVNDDLLDFSPVIRQRTNAWHKIRSGGKVTGSTINKSLGLESLKKQNCYIENRFYGKPISDLTPVDSGRMKYGSGNEINAISTLIGKILPALFPDYTYALI